MIIVPETLPELADHIAEMAATMEQVAKSMRYFDDHIPCLETHAIQLTGAARMARTWAEGIRDEIENPSPVEY